MAPSLLAKESSQTLASNPHGGSVETINIHANLVSSQHLLRELKRQLPHGGFTVEMRHNVYTIRIDRARRLEQAAMPILV